MYDIDIENTTLNLPKPFFQNTAYFIYVFDGEINIPQTLLEKGDSIITDDGNLTLQVNAKSTAVCFMIDKDAPFTKNGMYSGMRRN